ncbi:acyltransferase family protein [Desulfosporosinus sp. SB140]|uniref:acyltransferase family protein n=1 Tax=Desulfosporosinus paludis TaxID=3115649 RepID=UPI00388FEEC5
MDIYNNITQRMLIVLLVTFKDIYSKKDNSFNLIRFLLAMMVIYSHSFVLLGHLNYAYPAILNYVNYFPPVECFFIVSGFLVTQSLLESPSYGIYLLKRVLRIFPAFFVSLTVIAFIIGPIVSHTTIYNYFWAPGQDNPWNFVFKNITLNITGYSWTIRDVFSSNPFSLGLNGSMWTIKHEFAMYLILIVFSFFYFFKYRKLLLLTTFITGMLVILNLKYSYSLVHLSGYKWWVISDNEYASFIKLLYYFLTGSSIYIFMDKIYFSWRFIFLITMVLLFLFVNSNIHLLKYAFLVCLPYLILALGLKFRLPSFGKYGDFTYGLYIYAFPIQQLITYYFGSRLTIANYFILVFCITLFVSILSWKYIEGPSLHLKNVLIIKCRLFLPKTNVNY